jgi:hypothetical protein
MYWGATTVQFSYLTPFSPPTLPCRLQSPDLNHENGTTPPPPTSIRTALEPGAIGHCLPAGPVEPPVAERATALRSRSPPAGLIIERVPDVFPIASPAPTLLGPAPSSLSPARPQRRPPRAAVAGRPCHRGGEVFVMEID